MDIMYYEKITVGLASSNLQSIVKYILNCECTIKNI